MPYPSTLSTFSDPNASDRLNSPSHSSIESAQNAGIERIETFVGTLSSTQGTLMYDVRATASDGGGHVQSANKGGTGQTSFNKGDILAAQSSSVLSKLGVGTDDYVLTADSTQATGLKWAVGAGKPTVRTYSSTLSFWFKPSIISYAIIEVVGGGGNGGNGGASAGGGGGGGGGYSKKVVAEADLPAAASVLSLGGGQSSILSYFGSVLSASGGVNASGQTPGVGGIGFNGDINVRGGGGGGGSDGNGPGGDGGSTPLGGGGKGGGGAGGNYGGGGGGNNNAAGGTGAPGIVIIYEY